MSWDGNRIDLTHFLPIRHYPALRFLLAAIVLDLHDSLLGRFGAGAFLGHGWLSLGLIFGFFQSS
jgi:hypothetical protein